MQRNTNIVNCHTADSKPVKQEVNGTVILPHLVFPANAAVLAGVCEPYVGTACSKYIGQDYVFVSQGLTQSYIEQKLQVSIP